MSGMQCPKCGRDTASDYTGARICLPIDGGCGWDEGDCPEAATHGNPFRYCGSCSWTERRDLEPGGSR